MTHRWAVFLLAAAFISGCSQKVGPPKLPKTYPVRGKLLLANGKPVSEGVVVLNPTGQKNPLHAEGVLNADGSFEVQTFAKGDGAVPGSYVLTIKPVAEGKDTKAKSPKAKEAEHKKGPAVHIPEKYLAADSSGITVTVEEREKDLGTIKLEPEKAAPKRK